MMRYLLLPIFLCLAGILTVNLSAQCWNGEVYIDPGEYLYNIPGQASEQFRIYISADGADGGDFLWGANPSSAGGAGASMAAEFTVSGGDQLFVIVGESGFDAIGSPGGGGGGGGTAVIINGTDVLIAAGAGGGGGQNSLGQGGLANTNSAAQGGGGPGASGGGGFNSPGQNGAAGSGGGAGTLTSWGAGGTQGVVAGPGGDGFGGGGGGSGTGGGGGGGYRGGDGASNGSLNGKAGDSFVNTLYNSTVLMNSTGQTGGGNNNDGSVGIECLNVVMNTLDLVLVLTEEPQCNGGNLGIIEVMATGGTGPYTYTIDGGPGQNTGTFEGLSAGTYTLEVTDANGATSSISVTLTEPPLLELDVVNVVDVVCFADATGEIVVQGSGGTPFPNGAYNYYLGFTNQVFSPDGTFTGVEAGTYDVIVEDQNDCSATVTVTVDSNDEIIVITNQVSNVSCAGDADGLIDVSATGGFGAITYSLNGLPPQSNGLFSGLTAGTYTITVTDADGCSVQQDITITAPQPIALTTQVMQPSCSSLGSVSITAAGGSSPYEYSLDGMTYQTSSSFTGLATGDYTAYAIDANGCESLATFTINSFDDLNIQTSSTNPTCAGDSDGSINLSISGASGSYSISWSTTDGSGIVAGATQQNALTGGTYVAIVDDGAGCADTVTISLIAPPAITVVATAEDLVCNSDSTGSITLVNTGGGTGPLMTSWSTSDGGGIENNSSNQSGLTAGTYTLTLTDSVGCATSSDYTINEPTALSTTLMVQGASCTEGGSIAVIATGGTAPYQYAVGGQVLGNDSMFMDLAAGDYIVTVQDANGCTTTENATVAASTDAISLAATTTDPSCHSSNGVADGAIDLEVSGGDGNYTYSWTGNGTMTTTQDLQGIPAGEYTVTVMDGAGCTASSTYVLVEPDPIMVLLSQADITCAGESTGSVAVDSVRSGTAPFSYSWTSGSGALVGSTATVNGLPADIYQVIVVDANGCSSMGTATIDEPEPLLLPLIVNETGDTWSVTPAAEGGTEPYEYALGDPRMVVTGTVDGLTDGTYTFFVTDANDCTISQTVTLGTTNTTEVSQGSLVLAPNPAREFIHIRWDYLSDDTQVICRNTLGAIMSVGRLETVKRGQHQIDVSGLASGTYILEVTDGLYRASAKMIKL